LKAIGGLSHVTKDGNIVLRGGKVPAIYSFVVNKKGRKIGVVKDVIGPTSNPYVVVKPVGRFSEKELSSMRFYELRKRRRYVGGKKG
jgi:rRNA processing protein Gar1